jgi:conjugative relaxase-like TrwC/TraI family protein
MSQGVVAVTVSVRRMSAGTGYGYLMRSVSVGDASRLMSTPMTRYYTEPGTPPGRWMGAGLDCLDGGRGLQSGSAVSEDQLFQLLGIACDPVSGEPLGAAPRKAAPGYRERVHARLSALPSGLTGAAQAARVEAIRAEERARASSHAGKAVAGFDLTFSVPKSVSAVWAVADAATQQLIVQAHHAAIRDALGWAERNVFATRTGHGGATQVGVRGVIAAAFDHPDSRAHDPHLHTHVVVANRVQAEGDDKWRTLDSRAVFRATVALSELHQGLLMDRVTGLLGVGWDGRVRKHSPTVQWEITGVPDSLRTEYSRRSSDIDVAKDDLLKAYVAEHGHSPSTATVLKLRQQATLDTRPDKDLHSLAELTEQWRDRSRPHIGPDTADWARRLPRPNHRPLQSADLAVGDIERIAEATLDAVATKRATFTRWNIYAETQRQLQAVRFATAADRELVGDRVTDTALGLAILLTPPAITPDPAMPLGVDEPGRQRDIGTDRYTTQAILDAEERLLAAGRDTSAPAMITATAPKPTLGRRTRLTAEQAAVIAQIAGSGRSLDVLVGAAGTGKTVAMAGLATAWQARFGPDAVLGLAPSAAAADVLAEELLLPTENTAKWTIEAGLESTRLARIDQLRAVMHRLPRDAPSQRRVATAVQDLESEIERWGIKPNQLVIIDEASLAGTLVLDRIVTQARDADAKVLLVGDWAQLSAIEAGGAFAMLVRDRDRAPELVDIRRFEHAWEKQASLDLRAGDPVAIDAYATHGRIHDGDHTTVLDQAYSAWLADQRAGKKSLLIAGDTATVTELNARARADLVFAGHVSARGVTLADGTTAGVGDRIVTRRNNRTLTTGRGWVKNGDQWTVVRDRGDGTLAVKRGRGSKTIVLPADYVRDHVELGYATTAHRAQGRTVDTAHAIVTGPGMTLASLYVALTRGRLRNRAYVATDYTPDPDTNHGPDDTWTTRDVLTAVLDNTDADLSGHESIRAEQSRAQVRDHAIRPRITAPAPEVPWRRHDGLSTAKHPTHVHAQFDDGRSH